MVIGALPLASKHRVITHDGETSVHDHAGAVTVYYTGPECSGFTQVVLYADPEIDSLE